MPKIAILLIVALAMGVTAPPVYAGDGPKSPIGPFALLVDEGGGVVSCYDLFALPTRLPNYYTLAGTTFSFRGDPGSGLVMGNALVNGDSVTIGLEAFPSAELAAVAKLGGLFALSTLTGTGQGFHLVPGTLNAAQAFAFAFLLTVLATTCAAA